MAPKGSSRTNCNCRPAKPCYETIEKMILAARQAEKEAKEIRQNDAVQGDERQAEAELETVPTVRCKPLEQSGVPAEYPGAPCFPDDDDKPEEEQNSERKVEDLKKINQDAAAKSWCPCDACGKDAEFAECANPFTEFERNYANRGKGGDDDCIPASQLLHDCREHRDRPRDRAPGDSHADFIPKPCKECSCCMAFRPHPPATLATTDLYRTCGLPKRFRYPSWFKGYGTCRRNPLYRTTSSEIGRYPPSIHTVPTVYRPVDRTLSTLLVQIGPHRDKGLRTTGSIWDAYTYYDFW